MSFLYFLEGLRTPFLDTLFSLITHLGEETLLIVIGILIYWCISKREGLYLLAVGLTGTVINQFLKLFVRIPRPWVLDENFTIVESARAEATGYSFPSGHTQSAVGVFGCIARWNSPLVLRIVCVALAALTAFSRMYLGVHTPLDVGVSVLIAAALVFLFYPLVHKVTQRDETMRALFVVMIALSAAYLLFAETFPFPADIDADSYLHGVKNAYKMLGCISGLFLAFELERRYIHFEEKAALPVQALKLALGLVLVFAIKEGTKPVLRALFAGHHIAEAARYFFITVFAGCVWPLSFRRLNAIVGK